MNDLKTKLNDIDGMMAKIKSLPASRQAEVADLLRQAGVNIDRIKTEG
jgi:hypothetical protein